MKTSTERFLTTHTGSLPRRPVVADVLLERERGVDADPSILEGAARKAVREVVAMQVDAGIDIVNDGEQSKPSYATYMIDRVSGFGGERRKRFPRRLDSSDFPDWARTRGPRGLAELRVPTCDGPLEWKDFSAVQSDIDRLREALAEHDVTEAFMTAASPGVISVMLTNAYYPTNEAYLEALAAIMAREYEAIVAAGFVLQIDCPDLAMSHNSEFSDLPLADFTRQITKHVDALNQATANISPERMRMHVCWGNYNGPHNHDIDLREILPVVLQARPQGLSFEAANPRHAHEWKVWRDIPLPDDKVIVPGVLDTTTNYVEHPELVAERIVRYAGVVGRERVLAGADCGFGSMIGLDGVEASVAWAKLRAMVEGARRASDEIFG